MTYRTDSSYVVNDEGYDEDDEEPRRGLLSQILIVALLLGTGSGSALAWRTLGGRALLPSFASVPITTATVTPAAVEPPSGQAELAALRQEITGSVQSTQQVLAAQQAEIKRLTEQVAVLSGKLDLLQRPVTSAQAAIPAPEPKPAVTPAPKKKPEGTKAAAAKPAKPAEPKPATGAISTGGAPLPPLNR